MHFTCPSIPANCQINFYGQEVLAVPPKCCPLHRIDDGGKRREYLIVTGIGSKGLKSIWDDRTLKVSWKFGTEQVSNKAYLKFPGEISRQRVWRCWLSATSLSPPFVMAALGTYRILNIHALAFTNDFLERRSAQMFNKYRSPESSSGRSAGCLHHYS